MVGYIGENGAGKSTTIKMLTGILTPTSGQITVNGMNPHKQREEFVRTIGVVLDSVRNFGGILQYKNRFVY